MLEEAAIVVGIIQVDERASVVDTEMDTVINLVLINPDVDMYVGLGNCEFSVVLFTAFESTVSSCYQCSIRFITSIH